MFSLHNIPLLYFSIPQSAELTAPFTQGSHGWGMRLCNSTLYARELLMVPPASPCVRGGGLRSKSVGLFCLFQNLLYHETLQPLWQGV